MSDWEPTRIWRVVDKEGKTWCESSNEKEVRASMRPGDRLYRYYERREWQWRLVAPEGSDDE